MEHVYRNITYKLFPGNSTRAKKLNSTIAASRFVWNTVLRDVERDYKEYLDTQRFHEDTLLGLLYDRPSKPSLRYEGLGLRVKKIRQENEWIGNLSANCVKYILKYQADSWSRYFKGTGGKPRFKKYRDIDGFTIAADSDIKSKIRTNSRTKTTRINIPKIGGCVIRRKGGNPYEGSEPVKAVIKREGKSWRCVVCYKVPMEMIKEGSDDGTIGIDRNVGQIATSEGAIYDLPDTGLYETKRKRYQRQMSRKERGSGRYEVSKERARKNYKKEKEIRNNWGHEMSRDIGNRFGLVVVEDLNTKGMTKSSKGTLDTPGRNVSQKRGLNRSILKTGWTALVNKIKYKVKDVLEVDPRYTSQTCNDCGTIDKSSRISQSEFRCNHCGYEGNADVNAALNILALGTGATGRGRGVLIGDLYDPSTEYIKQHRKSYRLAA